MSQEALRYYDAASPEILADSTIKDCVAKTAQKLRQSRYPVIVCGTSIVRETTPDLAADSGLLLHAAKARAGLFYLMPGANAFGAALLSSAEESLMDVIEAIEKGKIKALMVVESDPFWSFPDQERLKQALDRVDLLLVMDYLPSRTARLAHIFLPTRTVFETETGFVNQEGRVQFAAAAHCGGIPISQVAAGNHPPRLFRHDIPGGEPEPAWEILARLAHAMDSAGGERIPSSRAELWAWIAREYPVFANVQSLDEQPEGIRVILGQKKGDPCFSSRPNPSEQEADRRAVSTFCLSIGRLEQKSSLPTPDPSSRLKEIPTSSCTREMHCKRGFPAKTDVSFSLMEVRWKWNCALPTILPRVSLLCPGTGNFHGKS